MPNDGTNLLEVPGNRLPETGSRQMEILHIRATQISKAQKSQGRISAQIFQPRPKDEIAERDIYRIKIFSNIPKGSVYQRGGRNKVKVKDLKPKRIKDYLECKISQRSPALLKYLLFNDF
ncbi:hypothetical protein GQ457_04G023360 [Hibiscus cannabinus]